MEKTHSAKPTIIDGLENPEDFAVIPGTDWIITSAKSGRLFEEARSFFINIRSHETLPAYPARCKFELDRERYGEISPPDAIHFHGLDVGRSQDRTITLYQINHPLEEGPRKHLGRESVEIMEIDTSGDAPSLRWRGAVLAPSWVWGNEVCALPEGGFAISNFGFGGFESVAMIVDGKSSGQVLEWHNRDEGWEIVEGTDVNAPNGLAISPDGQFYFIASWATKKLHKVSRKDPHGSRTTIDTASLNDNVTWTHDGHLMIAGQVSDARTVLETYQSGAERVIAPFRAIKVDPQTMISHVILEDDPGKILATTVVQISDNEVWVSSNPGTEILVYRL